jgi:hypothetical protein
MNTYKELFMSVDNLKLCLDVFSNYMQTKFGFDVINSKTHPKKVLYELMNSVHDKYINVEKVTLKDMNNIVLNSARDFYIKANNLAVTVQASMGATESTSPPPTRQTQPDLTFVSRPEHVQKPQSTEQDFKNLEQDRNSMLARPAPDLTNIQKPFTENAFDTSEFDRRLADLRSMRSDGSSSIATERLRQDAASKVTIESFHPKAFYEEVTATQNKEKKQFDDATDGENSSVQQKEFVVSPTEKTYTVERYMSINGFDRDWFRYKNRFQLVADFSSYADNDLQSRYRNITCMSIKRVIIPQEIVEECGFGMRPRTTYNNPMSFTFPYVLITIDEIADMYDGTNDNVRRSFCKMIVDKQFNAKNGRGFLVLQTMQDEKKKFYPTPLSRISRLTISIRKPNGELFNDSKDNYRVLKLEYEEFNPQFLKLVLDKYFDRNEFFKGDSVKLQNDTLGSPSLREFVNKQTGHEIMEMGQPNEQGYYKTFYINAPGTFDEDNGAFNIDKERCIALASTAACDDASMYASIMNMSLQCVVAIKLEQLLADPGTHPLTA